MDLLYVLRLLAIPTATVAVSERLFAMIALMAVSTLAAPMLLVSRLEGTTVQLVTVSSDGGAVKVIHTHPLAFIEGVPKKEEGGIYYSNSTDEETQNESLVRSVVFALDRKRRRIACLNIVKSRFDRKGDDSLYWEGWTLDADLMTLDYSGKLLSQKRVSFLGSDMTHIGIGDDGKAALIRQADGKSSNLRLATDGEGRAVKRAGLPSSFLRLSKRGDAELELRFAQRQGEEPHFDDVAGSAAWTDIRLPLFYQGFGSTKFCVDSDRKAAVLYGSEQFGWDSWVYARWNDRLVSAKFDEHQTTPMHLYPLDFPNVVGQDVSTSEMLPRFGNRALLEIAPYLDSKIVVYNLATKEVRHICKGILAIPM